MEKEVHPTIKLKELRNRAGYTIRALGSELKYKTSNNYAFYEDATRFKKKLYPLEFVLKLSKVFVGKGDPPISRIEVLSLSGLDELTAEEFSEMRPVPEAPLVGEVLAGHYVLEEGRSKKPEEFIPIASDKRYPDYIPRLVYRVGDDSADERFAKGSYIVCIKAQELARPIESGRFVVVAHHREDLVEKTIKRLEVREDGTQIVHSLDANENSKEPQKIDEAGLTIDAVIVMNLDPV